MKELRKPISKKIEVRSCKTVANFRRLEKFNYKGNFFKLSIDKNDGVYEVKRCEVLSWKEIEKGGKKMSVPDEVKETRDVELFNRIKGNPCKIAIQKAMTYVDASEI